MSQGAPPRAGVKTAAEVCARFALGEEARASLTEAMTPRQFLDVLREQGLYADAAKLVAHALPKRQAVWWACLGVGQALGPAAAPEASAALAAAREWVADPSDDHRRAARTAAEAAGFDTAAGCVALAVFFSGGSLAPPELPAVPPADKLTGDMVAVAIALAVVLDEPEKAPDKYNALLRTAIDVAEGKNLWPGVRKSTDKSSNR
jgi:hypothetical protein